ncbi:MAG: two-component regulator propeller domain-containing protein, partial [Bacteroidota bacterium]
MRSILLFVLFSFTVSLLPGQKYLVREYDQFNQLPSDNVQAIFRDSIGYLWVGTRAGLYRFDGRHFQDFNNTLQSLNIRDIIQVAPNQLWISNDQGILEVNIQANEVDIDLYLPASESAADSLLYYPNTLFRQKDGTIWISQPNATLVRWQAGQLKKYPLDAKCASGGSESKMIFAESPDGKLWVAAETGYLYRYDQKEDQFEAFRLPYSTQQIGALLFYGEQLLVGGDGLFLFHPPNRQKRSLRHQITEKIRKSSKKYFDRAGDIG